MCASYVRLCTARTLWTIRTRIVDGGSCAVRRDLFTAHAVIYSCDCSRPGSLHAGFVNFKIKEFKNKKNIKKTSRATLASVFLWNWPSRAPLELPNFPRDQSAPRVCTHPLAKVWGGASDSDPQQFGAHILWGGASELGPPGPSSLYTHPLGSGGASDPQQFVHSLGVGMHGWAVPLEGHPPREQGAHDPFKYQKGTTSSCLKTCRCN